MIAALVCAAAAAYLLQRRVIAPRALVLAAVFVVGILTIQVRGAGEPGPVWLGDGDQVFVTARVIAEGNLQSDGPAELHQRIDVQTEKIESSREAREVRAGIRLNIYSRIEEVDSSTPPAASAMHLFRYGERIRFPDSGCPAQLPQSGRVRLRRIPARQRYHRDRIREIRSPPSLARVFRQPHYVRAGAGAPQRHEKVHALWPEHVAGLMDAIVIGEESFIDRPERVDFQRSGTYHVLVVSGMNVSILAMVTL